MKYARLATLYRVYLAAGLLSIFASIGIWFFAESNDPAHADRLAIFVGLWAPTFIALAAAIRPHQDHRAAPLLP